MQVSARWPSYFLLLRQKKVTKEKASQRPCPFGYLALLAPPGVRRKLAALKQAPALIRAPLRCSARPNGAGSVCSFAALTLHTPVWARRARKRVRWRLPKFRSSVSGPTRNPLTTTATFTNLCEQTCPATSRTNAPTRYKKSNWLFKLPFTPAGVKGRGGSGG